MTSLSLDAIELLDFDPDFDRMDSGAIELTPQQIQQASSRGGSWTDYLEILAQLGLATWFLEQNLTASRDAGNRWVTNGFQVQGLMVSASEESWVSISQSIPAAHFYILTQVAEEHCQVKVSGFIRSTTFQSLIQSCERFNGDYELPIAAFEPNPATLLLALRCADPTAIALPLVALRMSDRAVNLRNWIQGQFGQFSQGLETVSETLSGTHYWTPLQTVGVRSELPQILQSLARQGIRLADNAQGASQVITVAQIPLRLYVVTGGVLNHEWEMLVVLESATPEPMPTGMVLRLSDDRNILVEQRFDPQETTDRSIFAEVVSGLDESVLVEIVLPNGAVHTLPRFVYQ
jgi:Protein of unknown function (DUF1822)